MPKSPRRSALGAALALLLAAPATAQFIPYLGKNKITYETFDWRVYRAPHFEVYYYPEFEPHLARIVSYAESAYQHVSGELKHEIGFPIPLILYKTQSDFEQTNLFPGFLPGGVDAFAEPVRNRMILSIDLPPDRLQGLITHELTHVFEFDLVPRSLLRREVPAWVDEGLADYMRGTWNSLDLMTLRDAAVTDQVPRLTRLGNDVLALQNPRLVYNMGHAAFEFIEARFGKEGIRQFLYTLRKNAVGGGADSIYQQAFRMKPQEFDQAFDKWLKERFKPFRDKERASDYRFALSPDEEKTSLSGVYAWAPSPSGQMVAVFTGNRSDGELDVALLSAQDGSLIRNLTSGYTGAFEEISFPYDFVVGRGLAFDRGGDLLAFFARREKRRILVVISALDGHLVRRIEVGLDQAESPAFLPDASGVVFAALREGVSDIFRLDFGSGQITNLTADAFADRDPQISPDGTLLTYTRRISGYDKVYVLPLADPTRKTQLTFGTFEDRAPAFTPDGQRVVYSSNEDDGIYNVRLLDLRTGVIRQVTDALGGAMHVAALPGARGAAHLGFITYAKGEFGLHTIDEPDEAREVEQEVGTADEAALLDFQPDVTHQIVSANKRRKKILEGLYLEGRPPINVGVTSGGDLFGGTQVALTDVMGDHSVVFTALSVREFRSYQANYVNLSGRLHWGVSAFDSKRFFFSQYFVPQNSFARDGAFASQRFTGATALAEYPLDKFRRLELSAGVVDVNERYEDPLLELEVRADAEAAGQPYPLRDGFVAPVSLGLVQETTRFREFGPLTGSTFQLTGRASPGGMRFQTVEGDFRKYVRLGGSTALFAFRLRTFFSGGDHPEPFYFGGNTELRGYDYLSFAGNRGFFANAELRLPVIHLAATPLGLIGPIRATLFGGMGGAHFKGEPYRFWTKDAGISYVKDPVFGETVEGYHLVDGRASFGVGLQVFFLGYPLHFDFSKLTDLKVVTEDSRFDFWIGYDF